MEIGSFIEFEFSKGKEYHKGENVVRLNTARAAIYHAVRVLGCNTVWLPYYQCDTVRTFLQQKSINIKYYHINSAFNPLYINLTKREAIVLVNYYGIMSSIRMNNLAKRFTNVIIDNSQAFFAEPIENCMNVYSARKFIGVPDGAYVIGTHSKIFLNEYKKDFSSDTSNFLFQRIEYGCEGKAYDSRKLNEQRIDNSDIKLMSLLTQTILDGANYDMNITKRKENFEIACYLFDEFNCINAKMYYDDTCIPMIYPLVIEDDNLLKRLHDNKIFQGHWWSYLLNEIENNTFEYWLSRYIIPITIDQRYGEKELSFTRSFI